MVWYGTMLDNYFQSYIVKKCYLPEISKAPFREQITVITQFRFPHDMSIRPSLSFLRREIGRVTNVEGKMLKVWT